jgi:hypothetical protein
MFRLINFMKKKIFYLKKILISSKKKVNIKPLNVKVSMAITLMVLINDCSQQ